MGVMADGLASIHKEVSSPDGQVIAELEGDRVKGLSFRGDTFRHYTERNLERQLARLALRVWAEYQRGYDAAVTAATGRPVVYEPESWDAKRRRFRSAQAETVSTGISTNRWVYVETEGMTAWQFIIRDGALNELDEPGLTAEVLSAYQALSRDYRAKMTALRVEHYGVSFQSNRLPPKETRT